MLPKRTLQLRTDRAEQRLLQWMVACGLILALAILAAGHARFAAGFATGAVLAILGYVWLQELVAGALDAGKRRVSKKLVFKLVIRYPMILGSLYCFYRTNWLPARAVLAGLFVPLAGALVECAYQVSGMLFPFETRPER